MKVEVVTVAGDGPSLRIKAETPEDEAVLNAIAQASDMTDEAAASDYVLLSGVKNGASYESIIIGKTA